MQEPFISSIEFREQCADTILVCCSDGRTRHHVAEFLEKLGIEADIYAVPGGPLILMSGVEVFQDSMLAQKRMKFLAEEHDTKRVILLSHGSEEERCQCGMARHLWPGLTPSERVRRQKAELVEAAKRFGAVLPVPIECWYANVVGGIVQFEQIPAEDL